MITKLIATLAATCGLLVTGGDYAAKQHCCVKRAYCCSIKARCCGKDAVATETVATLPAVTTDEFAKPFCCVKRAYCCSIKRNCCPKTSWIAEHSFSGISTNMSLRSVSSMVSQRHCVILVGPDDVTIRDLNSRNGTFVNDRRVGATQLLNNGDRLRIGRLEFEVILQSTTDIHDPDDSEIAAWLARADPTEIDRGLARSAVGSHENTRSSETPPPEQAPGKSPLRPNVNDIDTAPAAVDVLKKFFERR